ncbi:MAG: hypothetical protein MUF39_00735 [Cyclobacteriaceae bacterium]|nr:hypothetical protein [Cyclobacteriaceae bacterium]
MLLKNFHRELESATVIVYKIVLKIAPNLERRVTKYYIIKEGIKKTMYYDLIPLKLKLRVKGNTNTLLFLFYAIRFI